MEIGREAIEQWTAEARKAGILGPKGFDAAAAGKAEALLYPRSLRQKDDRTFALLKVPGACRSGPVITWDRVLGIFGPGEAPQGFQGEVLRHAGSGGNQEGGGEEGGRALFGPLSHANAAALRRVLPHTAPAPLAGQEITFGAGDRLGAAGPGHLRGMRGYRVCPVLAQQSVRELELTGRDYQQVLDASTWAVFQEGYEGPWGADGDHLKSADWVRTALQIGFTMITADVSDFIRKQYAASSDGEVLEDYQQLEEDYRRRLEETYLPLEVELDTGRTVGFSRAALARTALIYGQAIEHALSLYSSGVEVKGEGGFDFELSVDETETPTSPEAHLFVAMECRQRGMKIDSLAPRFVGEFQKGIDYIGDLEEFERSFADHAALAAKLGHRISVHSGSDKFSVFPAVGRLTGGRFHLKTAGTHWLEAMKVIALHEPALYRRLHGAALERFEKATRYYHVTTDLDNVPSLDGLADGELPSLFDNPDSRQLIHITYGELLRDRELGAEFFGALHGHMESYWQAVERHTERHLKTLGVKQNGR